MSAGYLHVWLAVGDVVEAAHFGQALASLTVESTDTVRADLTPTWSRPACARPPDRARRSLMTSTTHPMLALTDEVRAALADGRAVVALESTIISHGMPYPRNVAMAREVEGIVRDGGAVPATIAVLDGIPRIGLSADELELLGSAPDVAKVSIRDLPSVVATRAHGATTVASTMQLAALAGIRVFVTGGLGACTRVPRRRWTSRPTSPSSRAPMSRWSAPA